MALVPTNKTAAVVIALQVFFFLYIEKINH